MAKKDASIVIENEGILPADEPKVLDPAPKMPETTEPALVRFWSMKERHQVALASGKNVIFKGYVFLSEEGSLQAKAIRSARIPDVREIVNKPFEDESDLAKFNKFLNDMVYTGERGMASKRGVNLLMGLFSHNEYSQLQADHYKKTKSPLTPDVIIMRALKTKSFKGGI
jgi:hypothetical protein